MSCQKTAKKKQKTRKASETHKIIPFCGLFYISNAHYVFQEIYLYMWYFNSSFLAKKFRIYISFLFRFRLLFFLVLILIEKKTQKSPKNEKDREIEKKTEHVAVQSNKVFYSCFFFIFKYCSIFHGGGVAQSTHHPNRKAYSDEMKFGFFSSFSFIIFAAIV